jgi:hypothetical protein
MSTAHQTHEMTATHHSGVDQKRGAILVSFLAMFLAIVTLGGNNAAKEATQSNILASNFYSFYQAKNIRQTAYKIASDQMELELLNDKLSAPSRAALEKKIQDYKKNIARYESEPETQEGKKELLAIAKQHETTRDLALRQDPWFDYSQSLLQIAIVLTSVGLVMGSAAFFWIAASLGLVGVVLGLNGFFLMF